MTLGRADLRLSGLAGVRPSRAGKRFIEPSPVVALIEGLHDLGAAFWRHVVLRDAPGARDVRVPLNAL